MFRSLLVVTTSSQIKHRRIPACEKRTFSTSLTTSDLNQLFKKLLTQ
jgi:hypothetical protein